MKNSNRKIKTLFYLSSVLCLSSCMNYQQISEREKIVSIQIIDKNDIHETHKSSEQLEKYTHIDFLSPQPYKKVIRSVNCGEKKKEILTSYHKNGVIHKYLETSSGRAHGEYKEWHPSGKLRIEAFVMEGIGDISDEALPSYIFDKNSYVFDEQGKVLAEIHYDKGVLTGKSQYFYSNGIISKVIPYERGLIHGKVIYYNEDGKEVGYSHYANGQKNGESFFAGNNSYPKKIEQYENGKLIKAKYFDVFGNVISEIIDGNGNRIKYKKGILIKEEQYSSGVRDGLIKQFHQNGNLHSTYHIKNGQKNGEEIVFYDLTTCEQTPPQKYSIFWKDGSANGIIKTWYKNGNLESEKSVIDNNKQGIYIAWYEDGNLMMVEEYDKNTLIDGKYLKKGEDLPVSRVTKGRGVATIFDKNGHFIRKIEYAKGTPVE